MTIAVCDSPQETYRTHIFLREVTCLGELHSNSEDPWPSWPWSPCPKEYNFPFFVTATVWFPPHATETTSSFILKSFCSFDVLLVCDSSNPSLPLSFSPQVSKEPSSAVEVKLNVAVMYEIGWSLVTCRSTFYNCLEITNLSQQPCDNSHKPLTPLFLLSSLLWVLRNCHHQSHHRDLFVLHCLTPKSTVALLL